MPISHPPLQLAFPTDHGMPFIVQRSESGHLGLTNASQTIDFTWECERALPCDRGAQRHGIVDAERFWGAAEDVVWDTASLGL